MKIGIMSMQRVVNYGSFLQAYGLKKTVEEMGHHVIFLDYRVEPCIMQAGENVKKISKMKNTVVYQLKKALRKLGIYKQDWEEGKFYLDLRYKYEDHYFGWLGMKPWKRYRKKVDIMLIGSDEVFNCLQDNPNVGFSRELFGVDAKAKKIITYAASCGNTTVERLEKYNVKNKVAEWLKRIDTFSVRDDNTANVVTTLTDKKVQFNLDPVLISDFSSEIPHNVDIENYIIVYAYPGRITEQERKKIKEYAQKKNKKLLCIGSYYEFCDEYRVCSPFEVLAYFKNADCIITDTFHGSIFSIITNRPFATIVRPTVNESYGNEEKIVDLLKRLKLVDRVYYDIESLLDNIDNPLDYEETNRIIKNEKNKAREYLKENLQ